MKINKIILYNFNSFEGMNEFDFSSTGDQKNIILIGGKNGAGKTSLFNAIKIALFGPLTYGYVGINPYYISKIKDCINSNVFQTDKVESKVQINISLLIEREVKEYEITREWTYKKQKLEEHYFVKCEGKILDDQEQSYFQNYLLSIIPPDLFEFFLFDGEEVGNIFSTSTYNTYVRNAVYTLCGLDIFEIIRKQTSRYVGKATTKKDSVLLEEYKSLKEEEDDEMWNLIPVEASLNSSKRDRLPDWDKYFLNFAYNQFELNKVIYTYPKVGDLFALCQRDNLNSLWATENLYIENISISRFLGVLEDRLKPVYEAARMQGYNVWSF